MAPKEIRGHLALCTLFYYNDIDNKEVILATTVYEILDLELQDGTEVKIRPLDLKRLRKVMAIIEEMNAPKSEEEDKEAKSMTDQDDMSMLSFLIAATKICIEKQAPELVADEDKFDEALDLPTMWKILEIAAGISMGNPNLQREVTGLPGLI